METRESEDIDHPSTVRPGSPALVAGTRVCVRNRFLGDWSGGFEVYEVLDAGYRIVRITDRYVLPEIFELDEVRVERRRNPMRAVDESYLDRGVILRNSPT